MIELLHRGQCRVGTAARAEQHGKRGEAHAARERDEQRRLVLAVTVARLEHLRGQSRQVAADAQRERDVAEVLRDPAMHRPQRVLQRPGILHVLGQLCLERWAQRVPAAGEPGVPARECAPRNRRRHLDPDAQGVGHGRKRLGLELRDVLRCPRVDVPVVRDDFLALEMHVLFLDARCHGRRHIDQEARAAHQQAGGDAPAAVVIAGNERLHPLDRVAPIDERAGRHAAQGHAAHLLIRVDGGVECHRRERLLLVRRLRANDFAGRLQDPDPVDRQLLGAARVRETLLAPRFGAVLIQNLHDLTIGAAAPPVCFEPDHAIVEQIDVVVIRIVGGIHGELVDRIVAHRGIARRRDMRSLRGEWREIFSRYVQDGLTFKSGILFEAHQRFTGNKIRTPALGAA